MKSIPVLFTFLLYTAMAFAQNSLTIKGTVTDDRQNPVAGVNIIQQGAQNATTTDLDGNYSLDLEFDENCTVEFDHVSFQKKYIKVYPSNKQKVTLNIQLETSENVIDTVQITAPFLNQAGETILEAKSAELFPNPTGDIGTVIKSLGSGVQSNNELSGQYNVRGGNYDENLVYVNDFEVYRPFLMSSGQQEGLSYANLDLTDKLYFSSGGFEAKYADKMSSVLNVRYKTPEKFHGSVMASLLGVNAHVEGTSGPRKDSLKTGPLFTYLVGVRYKSNAYLLGSLDQEGEYNPNFYDIQGDFHIKPSPKHDLEFILNHSANRYTFIPTTQETRTGTFSQLVRFLVEYEGYENDYFLNTMAGTSYKFVPNDKLSLKFLGAFWKMREAENFDITGYYSLDEIDIDPESDNFGNVKQNLGVGAFQDWARNQLDAIVANGAFTGKYNVNGRHLLEWGTTVQHERIDDKLSEWQRIDSAGYSIPYNGSTVTIQGRLRSANDLNSLRVHGYFQDTWDIRDDSVLLSVTGGVRYHYWNVNGQFLVSPRVQLIWKPVFKKGSDVTFRFATGMYAQPPFYREIRDFDGVIHRDVKAQQSVHVVFGSDYNFTGWGRNFKLTTEAYYKYLWNINPYEIDDIRIRYFAKNNATGYATGVDLRLFGEMVKGTDSWVSISYLRTREDLQDDFYYNYLNQQGQVIGPGVDDQVVVDSAIQYPGSIRRPTDQAIYFNLYFQDYLLKNNNFSVHLNLIVGSGLPYGPPDRQRYKDVFKMPPYRRLDIGFAFLLVDGARQQEKNPTSFWSNFNKIWLSAEVFNILGISNTLSYRWIKDTQNQQWAIPNYLTSRRFNLKLQVSW